jgi:hypothetical protein
MPSRSLITLFALTLVATFFGAPSAQAVTSITTGSCVDGGGRTWHTKVVWGGPYMSSSATRKIRVDFAGWTTAGGGVPTDSVVTMYGAAGTPLDRQERTAVADYADGTVWEYQNPANPLNTPTAAARVTVSVGIDGDGKETCTVTHRQPQSTASRVPAMGASAVDHAAFDELDTAVGPLRARRTYDRALPRSFSASKAAGDVDAGRRTYWSFKPNVRRFTSDPAAQAAFSAFLDTIPSGHETVIVAWHEPEDNIHRGDFTLADWGQMNNLIGQIIRAKNRPELRHGICLKGPWTFDSHSPYFGYDWESVLDFDLIDVVGIDPYKFHSTDPSLARMLVVPDSGTGGSNPSTMRKLVTWGKPVALMEWGIVSEDRSSGKPISDAMRARWISNAHAWMRAWNDSGRVEIEAALYFHLDVATGKTRLTGKALKAFATVAD